MCIGLLMDCDTGLDIVTGATGYTGKYITRRLLGLGRCVRSLTGHLNRANPFDGQVALVPYNFDDPIALAANLEGATTLYNTYWVRFSHGRATFDVAVQNTKILLEAAKLAGVRRVIHVSIANPDERSPLPYYKGKALLERAVMDSGLEYAILRPTVIFGREDILINNIAWLLRTFPVFAIAGSGQYRIQPVFVEDLAELAVQAAQSKESVVLDAVGPQVFTFNELVRLIARAIQSKAAIIHTNPTLLLLMSKAVGSLVKDVLLTREEIDGLMADLLVSSGVPTAQTRFSEWLGHNAGNLGRQYASELKRHYSPH